MKKRFLAVLLTLCMICVSTAGISASAYCTPSHYSDVSTSATYYPATCYLRDHGLMVGTSYNVFSPNDPVTRGQMVAIIWRMFNKPSPDENATSFPDCHTWDYYYTAVLWASSPNVRIAFGHDDGNFYPENTLSQQDAFVFLYRAICYAKYISRNDVYYKNMLANSDLVYRGSVTEYAKPAFGWASSIKLPVQSVNPLLKTPRRDFAQYVYKVIKEYQKKYALSVSQSYDFAQSPRNASAMAALFRYNGASTVQTNDIERSAFEGAMSSAFSNAKPLDMCYLYLSAHGNETGIALFNSEAPSGTTLTPQQLRNYIDKYKGSFVVFVLCCNSGTFIGQSLENVTDGNMDNTSSLVDEVFSELPTDASELPADASELPADASELPTDTSELPTDTSELPAETSEPSTDSSISTDPEATNGFDADWFARVLAGEENDDDGTAGTLAANLTGSKTIRVLCSSRSDQTSHPGMDDEICDPATHYWCLGAGYNVKTSYFGSLAADVNKDKRISLRELHQYTSEMVKQYMENGSQFFERTQDMVCYPTDDPYIILESSY